MDPMLLPLLAAAPVLLAVAYFDLRFLRIPDALSLITLVIFAASALMLPMPDLMGRLIAAALLFAAGFLAFAFRLLGAGDVKFLSALVLLVPTAGLSVFANLFALALLAGIALVVALRRLPKAPQSRWKALASPRKYPMGLSIAAAGLAFPALTALPMV